MSWKKRKWFQRSENETKKKRKWNKKDLKMKQEFDLNFIPLQQYIENSMECGLNWNIFGKRNAICM